MYWSPALSASYILSGGEQRARDRRNPRVPLVLVAPPVRYGACADCALRIASAPSRDRVYRHMLSQGSRR